MMGFLIGFPLFIVAPCVIAAWIGTRVRSPLIAFVVTWVLTPLVSFVLTIVGTPILRAITPANNDGTGAIMIPFFGIATGAIAGIVAAVIVRRRGNVAPRPGVSEQNEPASPDGP
jgi:hypothetical protein